LSYIDVDKRVKVEESFWQKLRSKENC